MSIAPFRRFLRRLFGRESTAPAPATAPGATPVGMVARAEAAADRVVKARCKTAGVFSIGATEIDPRHLAIWITTATDRERDRLRADKTLEAALRQAVAESGYPAAAVPRIGFAFEPQQTVNREHKGNRWYAIK